MELGSIFGTNVDVIGQRVPAGTSGAESGATSRTQNQEPVPLDTPELRDVKATLSSADASSESSVTDQQTNFTAGSGGLDSSAAGDRDHTAEAGGYDPANGFNGDQGYSLLSGYMLASDTYNGISDTLAQYEGSDPQYTINIMA
jgi:hypothetical protein